MFFLYLVFHFVSRYFDCRRKSRVDYLKKYISIRVAPDTELAGYPAARYRANNFAGYQISGLAGYRISGRISGKLPSAVYIFIIRQGRTDIVYFNYILRFPIFSQKFNFDNVIWQEIRYPPSRISGKWNRISRKWNQISRKWNRISGRIPDTKKGNIFGWPDIRCNPNLELNLRIFISNHTLIENIFQRLK